MWLETMSINLELRWRTTFRGSKVERIPFNQLFMSAIEPLSFCCCLKVIFPSIRWWDWEFWACLLLSSDLMIWLYRRVVIYNWFLLLNFWRCNCIEIRLVIAFIPIVRNVQNMPKIHTTAHYWILLSTLRGCDKDALL